MKKIIVRAAYATPSAIGAALVFLSTVKLSDAKNTLTGNLKELGLNAPAAFETAQANSFVLVTGLSLIILSAVTWLISRPKIVDFEDVGAWPISVELGPHVAATHPPDGLQIFVQGCRFSNLSTTQSRDLDIELKFPTLDPDKPYFIASTTHSENRPTLDRLRAEGKPIPNGRTMRWLEFPIHVRPNEIVEGQIEFDVSAEGRKNVAGSFEETVRFLQYQATVIDRRTGQQRQFKAGECYDARLQRAYRGKVGNPKSLWKDKWRDRMAAWGNSFK